MTIRRFASAIFIVLGLMAAQTTAQAQVPPIEKPFAEHHVVFQLSDDSEAKQQQVLNNVENVMKAYGPDKVAIEVVAFGPGLALLRDDNPKAEHLRSLITQGIRFDACQNTIDTWERNNGKPYPLNPMAQRVPAGVVQIMFLVERGYVNIRP
jgi:intracellular sulfur oxidation DsrE/DsrF family protein